MESAQELAYWRNVVALCSQSTPESYLEYLKEHHVELIVARKDRVDLGKALEDLNTRYDVKVLRVDSGGTLNGALLRAELADEVSVVVYPILVGGCSPSSIFRASDLPSVEGVIPLRLIH